MPTKHDANYAAQLALWLDEAIGLHNGDPATIATSELGSWQVDGCVKGGSSGHYIAAYFGKSEPNTYFTAWGKERRNNLKGRRTRQVVKKLVHPQTHQFKYYDKKPLLPSVKDASKCAGIGTDDDITAHGTIDEVTRRTNDVGTHGSG